MADRSQPSESVEKPHHVVLKKPSVVRVVGSAEEHVHIHLECPVHRFLGNLVGQTSSQASTILIKIHPQYDPISKKRVHVRLIRCYQLTTSWEAISTAFLAAPHTQDDVDKASRCCQPFMDVKDISIFNKTISVKFTRRT